MGEAEVGGWVGFLGGLVLEESEFSLVAGLSGLSNILSKTVPHFISVIKGTLSKRKKFK